MRRKNARKTADESAEAEKNARKKAEDATKTALAARKAAEDEKNQKEKQLDRAELLAYAGKLSLAQIAFQNGNGALGLQYLDECQWNLRGWEHRHLWTRFNSKQTFLGHTDNVNSVAFSADGKRIVSGSDDNTVKVWDAVKGQEVLTLKGHTSEVSSVAISPDGKRIVSGSNDADGEVWDAPRGWLKSPAHQCSIRAKKRILRGFVFSVAYQALVDGSRIVSAGRRTLEQTAG